MTKSEDACTTGPRSVSTWSDLRGIAIIGAIAIVLPVGFLLVFNSFMNMGAPVTPTKTVTASTAAISTSRAPATSPYVPGASATPYRTSAARRAIRWRGRVSIDGPGAQRDLDSRPPQKDTRGGDIDGVFLRPGIRAHRSDAQISLLQGTGAKPDFETCKSSTTASGVERIEELRLGDTLCVKTSEDRIARLRTVRAERTDLGAIVQFDVVIWEAVS